MDDQDLIPKRC